MFGLPSRFCYLPWLAMTMLLLLSLFVRLVRKAQRDSLGDGDDVDGSLLIDSVMYAGVHQHENSPDDILPTSTGLAAKAEDRRNELKILQAVQIQETYKSFGRCTQYLLCLWRIISFLFFSVVAIAIDEEVHHTWGWYFFTTWNLWLLAIFFFLASTSSLLGMFASADTISSYNNSKLSLLVYILFEVAFPAALLVTAVDITILNPPPSTWHFWNMTIHIYNSVSMIVEFGLNRIEITRWHCILFLFWIVIYTIFIWLMVFTGVVQEWPYDFLQTETWDSFLWYSGLLIGSQCMYYGISRLSMWKMKMHKSYLHSHELQAEVTAHDQMFSGAIGGTLYNNHSMYTTTVGDHSSVLA
jgi:hypothetical protein